MLQSIIFKILLTEFNSDVLWIKTLMDYLDKSFLGQVIIKQEKEVSSDENAINKSLVMKNFSSFFDRILAILLVFVYAFMYSVLMPKDRLNNVPYAIAFESDY